MSNIETDHKVNDWREDWFKEHSGYNVTIISDSVDPTFFDNEINPQLGDVDIIFSDVEQQIVQHRLADAVSISPVDTGVGASGYGIGIILEFLDIGADIIAFASLAVPLSKKIKQAYKKIISKFRSDAGVESVYFSEEAIKILSVSDLIQREKVEPKNIISIDILVHDYPPPDNAKEIQIMYSAYTVAIKILSDEFVTVWNYLIVSDGRIVSRSKVDIPIPNMTHWTDPVLPKETLLSLHD